LEPKVGEYWYISSVLRISWDGNPPFIRETHILLARCIKITNNRPIFHAPKLSGFGYTVYGGESGWNYELLYRWEPNWFWKLLGYK
jgi:hypothetical protein